MPSYKLTYFDGRGLAEPIRLLFAYGNVDYNDNRIKHEEWEKYKASTPYGQVPFLETDGVTINQSLAIARFVGKLVGLGGKTDLENAQIDALVDTVNDMRLKLYPIFQEQDPEKKKELATKAKTETIPYYLAKFDESIKKNGGFVAIPRLSWADVYITGILPVLKLFLNEDVDLISVHPNLKALIDKIENIPQIKKWIETRPVTPW